MRTARVLSFIVLGAGVTLVARDAMAQAESSPDGVRLVWSRGPEASSCSDASEVEADVVRRLGWNPFSPSARRSIEGHVTRENGTWTATLDERDADGKKAGSRLVTSRAESCASLSAAAGLAIALIVRSGAVSPPSPPVAPPTPPPAPPPCPECPKLQPSAEDSKRPVWFAAALGTLGVLPEAAVGVSFGGRVPLSHSLSAAATLSYLPEVSVTGALGDYEFGATLGALGACYDVELGADVAMSGCVSAALGAMHVIVAHPVPVEPGTRLFSGAVVGPRLAWSVVPKVALVLGVDALFPFDRSVYAVESEGVTETVFAQPAVAGLLTLGVGFAP